MNATSKDIKDIIDGESSLGLISGTDLFIARMPNEPNDCTVVYDNPGGPPMLTMKKDTSTYYYSSVSIQTRSTKYATGYAVIDSIFQYLHGLSAVTMNDTYYAVIRALADPQLLHYDETDRPVFVINFEVQRALIPWEFNNDFGVGFNIKK